MSELRADLTAIKSSAQGRYDLPRLRYIESLLRRAESAREPLAKRLNAKVLAALYDYRMAMPATPDHSPVPPTTASPLHDLNRLLDSLQGSDDPDIAPLEQTLRQQELELVDAASLQAEQTSATAQPPRQEELRAARRFHSAMVRLNADKVVTDAIAEIPESCGPLNPQRLATRSLETMRDLSPHYLSRFVSYIDTLFWLEEADKKHRK
ncbi:DUF2894 domain-containing protein [Halioglobus maricola]|uniref:DUF2894 domain-containing protein n=1 Tax=Halioglobus maricola TaxID=2601894 RepID=A0A5P9NM11_9GAMM|nr:DUF2894 domain-containing protein [Halioglobus maricola]QFU76669.1 DUF2894 domain-containing protein [Halioglobus maricola]